jgi:hypothetical protein
MSACCDCSHGYKPLLLAERMPFRFSDIILKLNP